MESNIPSAHTINEAHPTTPANPINVLILFLRISLIFQIVSNFSFLNFLVISNVLPIILGIFVLSVSAGFSFNILLPDI